MMGKDTPSAEDEQRPPLPPRPSSASASIDPKTLQALATTAVTPVDIQTLSFPDGSRGTFPFPGSNNVSDLGESGHTTPNRGATAAEEDDAASVASLAPTGRPAADIASLLGVELNRKSPAWNLLRTQSATIKPLRKGKTMIAWITFRENSRRCQNTQGMSPGTPKGYLSGSRSKNIIWFCLRLVSRYGVVMGIWI